MMNYIKIIGIIISSFLFWFFLPESISYSASEKLNKSTEVHSPKSNLKSVQPLYDQYISLKETDLEKASKFLVKGIQQLKKWDRDSSENTLLIKMYLELYNDLYVEEEDIDTSLFTALEVFHLPKIQNSDPAIFGTLCSDIGKMYSIKEENNNSIEFYQKAIDVYENSLVKNYVGIGLVYNNLAFVYGEIGHTHQVLKNYENAQRIWYKHCYNYISYNSIVLQNLINTYIEYGDLKSAERYLKIFNSYFSKTINPKNIAIEKLSTNDSILNATYSYLKSNIEYNITIHHLDKAQFYIQQMESLYKASNEDQKASFARYVFTCIEHLGIILKSTQQYELSKSTFERTEKYITNDFYSMKLHANLGILYYDQKEYKSALEEINQAIQILPPSSKSLSYFMLSTLKSELLMELSREKESIQLMNLLFSQMLDIPLEKLQLEKLSYKDFNELNTTRHISLLNKSAEIFELLYEKNHSKTSIENAANFYKIAAEMFKQYYLKGFYNKDLDQYANKINEGLINCQLILNKKNKIQSILNTIENNESQHLWKKFIDRQSENTNLSNNQNSKSSYSEFSQSDFDIENFQKKLSKNELIVKYIVGSKNVYALVIEQSNIELILLQNTEELKSLSKKYYQQIIQFDKDLGVSTRELHRQLILPLRLKKLEKITFIMDDFLHLLPMETILTPQEFGQFISIGYAYSLKLLEIQSSINIPLHKNKLAVFAPIYTSNITNDTRQFNQLNFTQMEADAIIQSTNGRLFEGKSATKENFIQAFSQYNVLHLAMHAIMDTNNYEQSYLAFQNNQPLYFNELYDMKISSQLAILSACNTGNGILENGEGNMSLSRAFTYAGVPATIHSLWEVPDKQTAQLMELFYELLKDGHDPAKALTLAKKEFVKKYPQNLHPFFWAGFVFNGHAPSLPNHNWILLVTIAFMTITSLGLVIWKRNSNKQSV
ncbi:MAG TPA: CHAT domain-containing protein [Chitinophagales bacterium]|nr:CHAT domain-containing protein [Chitinophagales bacterium]